MNNIDDFAKEIASDIPKEDGTYAFDIGLIMIIASIVINVVKLLIKCNIFGRKIEDRVKNPGTIDKILLGRAIKKELPEEYLHLKESIKESILIKVQSLPKDKIYAIIKEAENAR